MYVELACCVQFWKTVSWGSQLNLCFLCFLNCFWSIKRRYRITPSLNRENDVLLSSAKTQKILILAMTDILTLQIISLGGSHCDWGLSETGPHCSWYIQMGKNSKGRPINSHLCGFLLPTLNRTWGQKKQILFLSTRKKRLGNSGHRV